MLRIKVDETYKKPILIGKKTSTIRAGGRDYGVGDKIELCTEKEIFATAVITGIEVKGAEELTEEDAHNDGFKSKKELLKALEKYYGDLKGSKFTVIKFKTEGRKHRKFS